jgi:hypothetical protein
VYKEKESMEKTMDHYFAELYRFTEPMSFGDAFEKLFSRPKEGHTFFQEYTPAGWVATTRFPARPERKLDNYIAEFKNNPVSDEITQNLLQQIRRWTKAGIRVYAFRPPTCAAMVEVENTYSGYNQQELESQIKAAGGIWIGLDQDGYESFDGSHLQRHAALALSRKVAQYMKNHEKK